MKRSILALTLVALVASVGCNKAAPAATDTNKAAPELPKDVQSVAAAATMTTGSAGEGAGATQSTGVATETNGVVVATGEFVSPVRSELAVKTPGRVAKMFVDEGSHVAKGQPILELETDYLRLNLDRANADTARAKAAEDDARRDLDRKKDLIAKDSIPRATYDRSQSAYDQSVAMRQSTVAQAALLRQQINDATLRSPIDGVVAEKRADVGERLSDNSVAVVIVQISPLKLRFKVPERYLASVHVGDSVKATVDPYPNETFAGRVTTVGGVVDSATRSFLVETEFANRDGKLKPGLFARVEMNAR
ncbi:MAG TPA: efflux RND transporter periplasmic adaptor subunit [Thermoanaerobaculia bacterium]|nr:efflux RND transporter periplasmic adaptor subunit [Thermoanaerobaculia bacterium]